MSRRDERGSIAEFHDIGKIVNWFALGLQGRGEDGKLEREPHDFEKCMGPEWGIDFSAPVWEAIFRKSDLKEPAIRELRLEHFPGSRDWFIVSIADELAAGMGRLREEQFLGDPNYSYYCLWTGKARGDLRLAESHQLNELICHLNTNPSWEDTCRKYFQILRSRVETAHPGLNVSTLHAHVLLTGKLARLLKPLASAVTSTMYFKDAEKASGAQKLVPVLLEIVFPQQPFRTRDLAIFQARRNAIASAAEHFKDNLLIRYGNYLLALFLSAADANGLIQFFANQGLIVRVKSAEQTLQYLSSPKIGITEALARAPAANWFGELPNLIAPPLCENCQMAHGDHRWPADFLTARGDLSPSARERISSMPWMALRGEDFAESDLTIIGEWLDEPAEVRLCARCFVFSYTTLAGALTEVLGSAGPIHAAARFLSPVVGSNREILTFAPRDRVSGVSTIPLQVEYLVNVVADLFILESDATCQLPKALSFSMAAMRSKGFGRCLAERIGEHPAGNPRQGRLCLRLPDLPEIKQAFRMNVPGNSDLKMGYLFNASAGTYIRSFFEGSAVTAYAMILYPG